MLDRPQFTILVLLFVVEIITAYPLLSDVGHTIGVQPGINLVYTTSSSLSLSADNLLIEGKLFVNDNIDIYGANPIVRNCRFIFNDSSIINDTYWAVQFRDRNPVLDHCEIIIADELGCFLEVAVKTIYNSVNFTITNNYIKGSGDCMQIGLPGLVDNNYLKTRDVTGLAVDPWAWHHDGVQYGGTSPRPPISDWLTISNNNIDNPNGETGCISLFQDFGTCDNIRVEGNRLDGGGYSLYAGSARTDGSSTNIVIVNNVWSTAYHAIGSVSTDGDVSQGCGYYGPVVSWNIGPGNFWHNNTWLDGSNATQFVEPSFEMSAPAPSPKSASTRPSGNVGVFWALLLMVLLPVIS